MFGVGADPAPAPVPRSLPLSLCAPGTALDHTRPVLPLSLPLTNTTSLTDLHSPLPNLACSQGPLSLGFYPSTAATQPTVTPAGRPLSHLVVRHHHKHF